MNRRVTVIGGGLAGISAALACADAGAQVTLVEKRKRLGGLTWSFEHDGLTLDNGQHVFLRCCTAYLDFLGRLGSAGDVELQDRLDVTVVRPGPGGAGHQARLRRDRVRAPLHLARSLIGYGLVPLAGRLRLGPAAVALSRLDLDDPALDETTFGEWLARHHQSDAAVQALWELICLATVNLRADEASLAMAAKVFQTGLLTDSAAGDIGWSRVPLGLLHGQRGLSALEKAGVKVLLGDEAVAVRPSDGTPMAGDARLLAGVGSPGGASPGGASPGGASEGARPGETGPGETGAGGARSGRASEGPSGASLGGASLGGADDAPWVVTTRGRGRLEADAVVVALPHYCVEDVLPPGALPGGVRPSALGSSPIVNVHVHFDRPVTRLPLAAGLGTLAQWVFDRTASSGAATGQYLAVSISGAAEQAGGRPAELGELVVDDLRAMFPLAKQAKVLSTFVTKEHHATFKAVPGSAAHRAAPRTALPGLVLAGAWTATGWPPTMEGAVRSGALAARAALVACGQRVMLPPLPREAA